MIGTVLGNRYEILDKVGIGGMAVVYKAMDRLLNRCVAVKLLRSEFQDNEEFIRRFNIESQAAASLSHANIVSIYDVGQSGALQYIVMEYIEGATLKDYIAEKKGAIYWKEATSIAMQICSALEHAHSKHIIHRDIKPQNIMINDEGVVKVTDFGIARAASGGTTTMEAMGSAHYLSPEQARGGYTDQKSDIYSLGVVLYELYTGKLPFDGETPVAVAMQHMQSEAVKPRNINPDIPKCIENIILKAMSKEQRLRYENASQMLSDIKKAYTDPDSPIRTDEEDADKFGTKKIPPIVNITIPGEGSKSVVRRTDEERITKTKSTKKKDTIAIVAAIVTCFVIACVMGVVAATVMSNSSERENEAEESFVMPNVKGLTKSQMTQAMTTLRNAGFDITEKQEYHSTIEKGEVITQSPSMGPINEGTPIVITISLGKEQINLDDYTGWNVEDAMTSLEDKGIQVRTSEEMSVDVEEGKIIRHLPSVGQNVETGSIVRLFVSSGPNKFSLAQYDTMDYAEAKAELEAQGVKVNVVEEFSETVQSGNVIRHEPAAGTEMKAGDEVTLYVSKGSELVSVPNVMGSSLQDAEATLKANNLELGTVREITSGKEKGIVVKQSENAGNKVKPGTAIDVSVSKGEETVPVDSQITSPDGL